MPNLNWNADNRKVKLNANNSDNRNEKWAVPVLRESSPKKNHRAYRFGVSVYEIDFIQPPSILPMLCSFDCSSR